MRELPSVVNQPMYACEENPDKEPKAIALAVWGFSMNDGAGNFSIEHSKIILNLLIELFPDYYGPSIIINQSLPENFVTQFVLHTVSDLRDGYENFSKRRSYFLNSETAIKMIKSDEYKELEGILSKFLVRDPTQNDLNLFKAELLKFIKSGKVSYPDNMNLQTSKREINKAYSLELEESSSELIEFIKNPFVKALCTMMCEFYGNQNGLRQEYMTFVFNFINQKFPLEIKKISMLQMQKNPELSILKGFFTFLEENDFSQARVISSSEIFDVNCKFINALCEYQITPEYNKVINSQEYLDALDFFTQLNTPEFNNNVSKNYQLFCNVVAKRLVTNNNQALIINSREAVNEQQWNK